MQEVLTVLAEVLQVMRSLVVEEVVRPVELLDIVLHRALVTGEVADHQSLVLQVYLRLVPSELLVSFQDLKVLKVVMGTVLSHAGLGRFLPKEEDFCGPIANALRVISHDRRLDPAVR